VDSVHILDLTEGDTVFTTTDAFSSFSVDDLDAARKFYGETLGLKVTDSDMGTIDLTLGNGARVFVYPKPNHEPATFTVLNFDVDDIDSAVSALNAKGVRTKIYRDDEVPDMPNDEKGIVRDEENSMAIAWFKDPAGNVIAVMQTSGAAG
jgi:predicted enzyme related to lactoylglutathione lyase